MGCNCLSTIFDLNSWPGSEQTATAVDKETDRAAAFICIDVIGHGQVNVTDLMGMMEWLYLGGESPFYPDTVVVASCDGVDV